MFVQANYRHGDHADAFGSTKYSYDSAGVLAGSKFYVTPDLTLGPTFGYTHIASDLKQGLGSTDLDSFHLGGFLAYDTSSLFVHAIAGVRLESVRHLSHGVLRTDHVKYRREYICCRNQGRFDLGAVRFGPIGGFTYTDTHVKGYSEAGDPFLTQTVAD